MHVWRFKCLHYEAFFRNNLQDINVHNEGMNFYPPFISRFVVISSVALLRK